MQQDGKVSKAFTLKLGHLNDFIKPANSTEKIRYNVDQMNRAWVSGMTRILIYHYESSIADFVSKISFHRMDPFQVQHFLNKTLEKGMKRYGKKLNNNTIREFKKLLMKGHPNKKEIQTSSFKTQQRATFQESRHTKVQNREAVKAGIRSVIGPRDPLSNFFQCRFNFRGYNFKSLEHAYQWEKAQYFGFRGLANEIEAAGTAAQAKSLAREIPHSENWDRIRISLMRELLRLKWEQVPIFRDELNACRSKEILHPVPDTFWGTGVGGKKGRNNFGILLDHLLKYHVRNSLSKGKGKGKTEKRAEVAPVTLNNRFSVLDGIDPFSVGAEWIWKPAPEPTTTRALVRDRKSPWKTDIIESTPVCSGDFPELPKPQRVTRSTRKTLNLTEINSTPTSLKRGPPPPSSPTEDEETSRTVSPPHKKKMGQNIKGCHPAMVRTHKTDKATKKSWTWPKTTKDTLIIGEENVSRITATPHQNVQLESFPGARFQHFTDMLKDKSFVVGGKCPTNIILALGINDRSSDPQKTSIRNLKTMLTWIKNRYDSSNIFLTEINYSKLLPKAEQTNIDSINRSMGHCEWATVIPKLGTQKFKIDSNSVMGILWKEDTANSMVHHWLDFLN